jgi:hypothetical protein
VVGSQRVDELLVRRRLDAALELFLRDLVEGALHVGAHPLAVPAQVELKAIIESSSSHFSIKR